MNNSLTNCKLPITGVKKQAKVLFSRLFLVIAFLCLFSANNFAQNLSDEEISRQAERLQRGDVETRRDALHRLRVAESENASRIAAEGLTDKTEIVRATAPFSVLELPSEEAVNFLLPQLRDRSEYVRRETAYALGKTRNVLATQPLLEIIQRDREYSVRCAAAVALGEIGDISAIPALLRILQRNPGEEDDFLRRAAARSIGQIAETTLQKEFLAQTEIKDYDAFVLANRKTLSQRHSALDAAVSILIKMLQNRNEADDPKREAAFALGAIGDLRAAPILQINLNAEDYYLVEIIRTSIRKILNTN